MKSKEPSTILPLSHRLIARRWTKIYPVLWFDFGPPKESKVDDETWIGRPNITMWEMGIWGIGNVNLGFQIVKWYWNVSGMRSTWAYLRVFWSCDKYSMESKIDRFKTIELTWNKTRSRLKQSPGRTLRIVQTGGGQGRRSYRWLGESQLQWRNPITLQSVSNRRRTTSRGPW